MVFLRKKKREPTCQNERLNEKIKDDIGFSSQSDCFWLVWFGFPVWYRDTTVFRPNNAVIG